MLIDGTKPPGTEMENLTDKQIVARVRQMWPSYYRLSPIARRYGWEYNRLYDVLRRQGALSEFGLGRRQKNPRQRVEVEQ